MTRRVLNGLASRWALAPGRHSIVMHVRRLTPLGSPSICGALLVLVLALPAVADDLFRDRVVPVIQKRCLNCHNSVDHKGDFALQSADELAKSGFIESGKPGDSHLLSVLKPQDGKRPLMPKNGEPLKAEEIAAFEKWISDGAKWPEGFRIEDPVVTNTDWWSFQPVVRPTVPDVRNLKSQISDLKFEIRNPVDAFILAKQREMKLTPSPEADRRTLIRRLTYDLTGLPPTPDDVDEFVNDSDPTAYDRLRGMASISSRAALRE